MILLLFSGMLNQYEDNIMKYKVFKSAFVETIFSQEDTTRFEGILVISRKAFLIDIKKPKKQMIFGKDTVILWLPEKAKAYQIPFKLPFVEAIFSPLSIFKVVKEKGNFAELIYQNGGETLFVKIKFNKRRMPAFISYTSDVSSLHFRFKKQKLLTHNITFIPELPDSIKIEKISSN